jgi:hypothetical protein
MPDLKISQLPEYTGNTSGSWLIMNNSGETTTYKVKKENWVFPYNGNATITGSLNVSGNISAATSSNFRSVTFGDSFVGVLGPGNLFVPNGYVNTPAIFAESAPPSTGTLDIFTHQRLSLTSSIGNVNISAGQFGGTPRNINLTSAGGTINSGSLRVIGNTTLTGSLNVTGSSTLNAGGLGNNILTGSINAMDAVGAGNYMVARAGGSNFLNAALNELSGSVKNRIIGPTEITGSLRVSDIPSGSTSNQYVVYNTGSGQFERTTNTGGSGLKTKSFNITGAGWTYPGSGSVRYRTLNFATPFSSTNFAGSCMFKYDNSTGFRNDEARYDIINSGSVNLIVDNVPLSSSIFNAIFIENGES